jgi:hypothetical protein
MRIGFDALLLNKRNPGARGMGREFRERHCGEEIVTVLRYKIVEMAIKIEGADAFNPELTSEEFFGEKMTIVIITRILSLDVEIRS